MKGHSFTVEIKGFKNKLISIYTMLFRSEICFTSNNIELTEDFATDVTEALLLHAINE